jgi:AraC-like DNA-binding protein
VLVPSSTEVRAVPAPVLRPYVTSYEGFQLSGFPSGVHLGPPTGALTAVIGLADPLVVDGPDGTAAGGGRFASLSSGLRIRSVAIRHDGHQHGIVLSLTPQGARALYGMPAGTLANTVAPFDQLVGPVGSELMDRVRVAPTWEGRFGVLDELLARAVQRRVGRRAAADEVRPEVAELWRRLVAGHGRDRVEAITAGLGWSRRHLTDRFRAEMGWSPKTLARVVRFEHAHRLATKGSGLPWAELSLRAGYADQAHLVREWRAFTGRTPTGWRRGETLLEPAGRHLELSGEHLHRCGQY